MGKFDAGKLNRFLTLIPILTLFLQILLTGGNEVGEIDYYIGFRISKVNQLLLEFLVFPILVAKISVKHSCKITVITINTQLITSVASINMTQDS